MTRWTSRKLGVDRLPVVLYRDPDGMGAAELLTPTELRRALRELGVHHARAWLPDGRVVNATPEGYWIVPGNEKEEKKT